MRSILLLVGLLAASANIAGAQDETIQKIIGLDHDYLLSAPNGWVSNHNSVPEPVAAFYPANAKWDKDVPPFPAMWATVTLKRDKQTFNDMTIDNDVFRANHAVLKIEEGKAIDRGNGKTARVRYFSNDVNRDYFAFAYIDDKKVWVMVTLQAHTRKDFDSSLVAFRDLVMSIRFRPHKVKTEK